MRPNVVVVDLQTLDKWAFRLLHASNHLFTVTNLTIHPFHLVIVNFTAKPNITVTKYVKLHMALDGRTPSEAAGIHVIVPDKWLTLIQNAKKSTAT